jgi:hypothetical protein
MGELRRRLAAAVVLAGVWTAPALALTEAQLREAVPDDMPEEAQFKAWPGAADRTLIAWTDDVGAEAGAGAQDDVLDLTVLVVQTSSGRVLQRYHAGRIFDSRVTHVEFSKFEFDTANYALAPGRRSFGIRLVGEHRGCGAEERDELHLLEPDGGTLREVLALVTLDHLAYCDCGEGHDVVRTLALAGTATRGHADLAVHERREDTPDGMKDPANCHPKVRHGQRTTTWRFDGRRYSESGR